MYWSGVGAEGAKTTFIRRPLSPLLYHLLFLISVSLGFYHCRVENDPALP